MFKPELIQRVFRFGIVGLAVMGFFMGLNWLLAPTLGKDWAFLAAYPPAVALHYGLNKWWTFGCERTDAARQIGEYLAMVFVTFLIQAAVFKTVTHFTTLPSWIAAGVANAVQMVVTFVVMQRRVFAPAAPALEGKSGTP
jgi:putative flippase GtrA